MKLSICIPNYNRKKNLDNCLNSILISKKNSKIELEVCVSDNCSEEDIDSIILNYRNLLNIKFKKNKKNFGLGKNVLESVSMASGEFIWILGNDDLILPKTLKELDKLFNNKKDIDFFFVNSFNLESSEISKFSHPFNTNNLPKIMKKFSLVDSNKIVFFEDLIDPKISFDFMLGLYLSIFRRKKWDENITVINQENLNDERTFSNFENTCPHVKIFSKSFFNSKVYIQAQPLSVNLSGEREWSDLYSFVETIRIPEALDIYLESGLPFKKYFHCKNFSLRNFIPSIIKIIINGKKSGLNYIKIFPHIIKNLIFPNFYLSPFRYIFKKIIR
tara:strand:+ start:2341 stop:3333 length:993 start_codon:yes stop_codon:yes gene_type:complete